MRIEKIETTEASPGSDAGCGLKRIPSCPKSSAYTASPGSDAGCGLKPVSTAALLTSAIASPGSDAGCGLKLATILTDASSLCITRQRCRVRIETP